MNTTLRLICSGLLCGVMGVPAAYAVTTATPPAGYFTLTAQGGSDTFLALPLVQRTAWMGRVSAISANTLTLATATPVVSDAAAPAAAAWYYAEFVTGPLTGLAYPVTGNADNVFTLELHNEDLTAHALGAIVTGEDGDIVRIRSGWSVSSLLGGGDEPVALAPAPAFVGTVYVSGDSVLLPGNSTPGTHKPPSVEVAFVSGQGWRRRGGEDVDAAGQRLLPWEPFTVRRQSPTSVELTVLGYVSTEDRLVRLPAVAADEDWDFAVVWPHAQTGSLGTSNLGTHLNVSPDLFTLSDVVLDYANTRRGYALPAAQRLSLQTDGWRQLDGASGDGFELAPGTGYLLRLRGERPVRYWKQEQPE